MVLLTLSHRLFCVVAVQAPTYPDFSQFRNPKPNHSQVQAWNSPKNVSDNRIPGINYIHGEEETAERGCCPCTSHLSYTKKFLCFTWAQNFSEDESVLLHTIQWWEHCIYRRMEAYRLWLNNTTDAQIRINNLSLKKYKYHRRVQRWLCVPSLSINKRNIPEKN